MSRLVSQVRLEAAEGDTERYCYVETGLSVGDEITLKNSEDSKRWWRVAWVSKFSVEITEINRGWNNNV